MLENSNIHIRKLFIGVLYNLKKKFSLLFIQQILRILSFNVLSNLLLNIITTKLKDDLHMEKV